MVDDPEEPSDSQRIADLEALAAVLGKEVDRLEGVVKERETSLIRALYTLGADLVAYYRGDKKIPKHALKGVVFAYLTPSILIVTGGLGAVMLGGAQVVFLMRQDSHMEKQTALMQEQEALLSTQNDLFQSQLRVNRVEAIAAAVKEELPGLTLSFLGVENVPSILRIYSETDSEAVVDSAASALRILAPEMPRGLTDLSMRAMLLRLQAIIEHAFAYAANRERGRLMFRIEVSADNALSFWRAAGSFDLSDDTRAVLVQILWDSWRRAAEFGVDDRSRFPHPGVLIQELVLTANLCSSTEGVVNQTYVDAIPKDGELPSGGNGVEADERTWTEVRDFYADWVNENCRGKSVATEAPEP